LSAKAIKFNLRLLFFLHELSRIVVGYGGHPESVPVVGLASLNARFVRESSTEQNVELVLFSGKHFEMTVVEDSRLLEVEWYLGRNCRFRKLFA
jgi:hypothetical protein